MTLRGTIALLMATAVAIPLAACGEKAQTATGKKTDITPEFFAEHAPADLWKIGVDDDAVDAGLAFVLAYSLACTLQVLAFQHASEQRLGLNRLGSPELSSDGFILRVSRSRPGPVVRCDAVTLHSSTSSFIVPAFGAATCLLCLLLTSPRYSAPITRRPASLF